ncbi:FecR domain-containing protein [Niabella aquatica]
MHKKQLLKKFLRNECSYEEAKLALKYMEEDPSLLDELLAKTEWDAADANLPVHPDTEEAMRRFVMTATSKKRRILQLTYWAAAACIAAVLLGAYWFVIQRDTDHKPAVIAQAEPLEIIKNNSNVIKEVVLADRSVVRLYPKSVIKFEKSLLHNRNIFLEGKAFFKVAKNKLKPFTVYSGSVSTTALGTSFMVNDDNTNNINVQLFEGKVVVKATTSRIKMEDIYLLPGKECIIDIHKHTVAVVAIPDKTQLATAKPVPAVAAPVAGNSAIPEVSLHFRKTEVTEVFSRLEKVFKAKIIYRAEDIEGAYFTGAFSGSDSLLTIIKVVCTMNGLQYRVHDNVIEVYKEKTSADDTFLQQPADKIGKAPGLQPTDILPSKLSVQPLVQDSLSLHNGIIMFRKKKLKDVLLVLAAIRKEKIDLKNSDIDDIYITGPVNTNDPLTRTLELICNMHALSLKINNTQFVIRKN